MITPLEIEEKEFTRGVRGYKEEEVDTFLNLIILEMENLIKENSSLKEENTRLKGDLESRKTSEEQIIETLETARNIMNDISASAEKRADVLLKNAELDADIIKREALDLSERLSEESKGLRSRVTTLREKYRNLLETELERFDTLSSEIFLEADDIVKSLPEAYDKSENVRDTVVIKSVSDVLDDEPEPSGEEKIDMSKTMINIR